MPSSIWNGPGRWLLSRRETRSSSSHPQSPTKPGTSPTRNALHGRSTWRCARSPRFGEVGARGAHKHGLGAVRSEPTCAGAFARFDRVRKHPAFAVDVDPYLERIRRTIA